MSSFASGRPGAVGGVVTADGHGQNAGDAGTAGGECQHPRPAAADQQLQGGRWIGVIGG